MGAQDGGRAGAESAVISPENHRTSALTRPQGPVPENCLGTSAEGSPAGPAGVWALGSGLGAKVPAAADPERLRAQGLCSTSGSECGWKECSPPRATGEPSPLPRPGHGAVKCSTGGRAWLAPCPLRGAQKLPSPCPPTKPGS